METNDRGLDLTRPDEWTDQEADAFRAYYTRNLGGPLAAYELWIEHRPDVLKRHRLQALQAGQREPWFPLLFLHYYAVVGYEDGIKYEIHSANSNGITRAQVLDTLAIAFFHAGPLGMRYVAEAGELLHTYVDREPAEPVFPAHWAPDSTAFRSGVDFSTLDLTVDDRAAIEDWYRRTLGLVPPYVSFLAEHRPRLLKAYRNRFESTIRGGLPKQMLPVLFLHLNVSRASEDGIRESLLLSRAWGVRKSEAMLAISWGMLYGGTAALSVVARAAGDVVAGLEE